MKQFMLIATLLAGALFLGAYLQTQSNILGNLVDPSATSTAPAQETASGEQDILYWVAPMDPNFRRDKPGKSPMGMDLVPVYADAGGDQGDIVKIDPRIVNNLGVRTASVTRGPLWRRINTVGYFDYDERKLSHVHVRTKGWIDRLYVKSDGERVNKGDLLFEIYSRELVNAQEEYLQARRAANDYLLQASRDRLQALGMSNSQIKDITKSGKAAQLVRYYAKQDGLVARLGIRQGMYVMPTTEVMALADLSNIWLLADVYERQANWVKVGQPVEVRLPYLPGRTWEGKVAFVYPSIDEKTRTLRVRLQFANPNETLKPEMYAEVSIFAGPKHNVLSVPREALIRTGEIDRIIVALGEGRFAAREVIAGMESGDWVEILEGIAEGEEIVLSGQFLIDSEASLRASIQRLGEHTTKRAPQITGTGIVNIINQRANSLNISHEPIAALGWPEMTMDFELMPDIDLEQLTQGSRIDFTLAKTPQGQFRIVSIQVVQ